MLFSPIFIWAQNAWINEIHYDNTETDIDEIIEVVIENADTYVLSDFNITLYNGNDGESYSSIGLDQYIQGQISEGFTILYYNYTANGFSIQNGDPDGLALSFQGSLIEGQFLSYEGTFTAANGPAAGELSTDIGVSEPGAVGQSLQLSGNGTAYSNFIWQDPATSTPGLLNNGQTFGTIAPDPEPDNHATAFTASETTWYSAALQWTDATGDNLPQGYLIKMSSVSASDIIAPADGIVENDSDSTQNITFGTEQTIFYNLNPQKDYFFKIWPYSNQGADIDYKLDGEVPQATAATSLQPDFINHETFESGDFGSWTAFSAASDKNWIATNGLPAAIGTEWSAQINGYQENEPSNDWLISPQFSLSNYINEKMYFYTQWKYGSSMEELTLKYSSDYAGGDPTTATWTDIPFTKPASDETWAFSDTINIAALTNSDVHFAFQYLSNGSPRRWNVDEIQITGEFAPETPDLVINEIMYNPPASFGEDQYFEFIECFNNDDEPISLNDYSITGDIQFSFPMDIVLQPGEYLVVAADPDSVALHYGLNNVLGPWTGELSNSGGIISIQSAFLQEVDRVAYDVVAPWPEEPNGTGPSMELLAPALDNNIPESWNASFVTGGTPGAINSLITEIEGIVISEIFYDPPADNYETIEYIEVYNSNAEAVNLGGCHFSKGIDFLFPSVTLQSGDYLVITKDLNAFLGTFGLPAYQWQGGDLGNTGDTLEIKDILGNVIDYVPFQSELPWDTLAAGHGPSLELSAPNIDNALPENWYASTNFSTIINGNDTIWCSPYDGFAFQPPTADFETAETTIYTSQMITFNDLSTGDPDFYAWSFPGGNPDTANVNTPHITYNTPGVYDVSLYVSNIYGEDTETKTGYITVLPMPDPPIADFEADNKVIFIGDSISFTDLSQNNPQEWEWTFVGATPENSNIQNPQYIKYFNAGLYDVALKAANIAGDDTKIKDKYITVMDTIAYDLIITEIMYNPPETDTDSLEFIEIYNNESFPVFLRGYYFSGVNFTFPDYIINPGEYAVITTDSLTFLNSFGIEAFSFQSGFLDNNGETISLFTPTGALVDQVEYDDENPWPEAADGDGPSLVFCDLGLDNSLPESWTASVDFALVNGNNDTIWASPGAPCGNVPVPVAAFTADALSGGPGLVVNFTDLSTNNPESWAWTFPGGTPESSDIQNPSVQYNQAGDFDVSLTVQNHWGSDAITQTQLIHIAVGIYDLPSAFISVMPNPSSGIFTLTHNFDLESTYIISTLQGKIIEKNILQQKQQIINLMHHNDGVYLLRITNSHGYSKNIKLIKN